MLLSMVLRIFVSKRVWLMTKKDENLSPILVSPSLHYDRMSPAKPKKDFFYRRVFQSFFKNDHQSTTKNLWLFFNLFQFAGIAGLTAGTPA